MNKTLGKYELGGLLGSGATSEVYQAHDMVLGREVALKILKPALVADPSTFERFLQEARSAASLFHPHIATILDMGEAEGRYYIAMRYYPGRSLEKILNEDGPLSLEETLRMAEQIGAALDYAHGQGLLHRDVKPSNILRTPEGEYILTDFGLARAMMSAGLTSHSGAILGTPAYIAPEIWLNQPAVPATDQYALACVFVETLTGEVLFQGDTPPAIMTKHMTHRPVQVVSSPYQLPQNINKVVQRMLTKEPNDRFANLKASIDLIKDFPDETNNAIIQGKSKKPVYIWKKITRVSVLLLIIGGGILAILYSFVSNLVSVWSNELKTYVVSQENVYATQNAIYIRPSTAPEKTTNIYQPTLENSLSLNLTITPDSSESKPVIEKKDFSFDPRMNIDEIGERIYGPKRGVLHHEPDDQYPEFFCTQLDLKNFMMEVTFQNSYLLRGHPDSYPWSDGIIFRAMGLNPGEGNFDVFYIFYIIWDKFYGPYQETGSWKFVSQNKTMQDGKFNPFDPSTSFTLNLFVKDSIANIYINRELLADLDLSSNLITGDLCVVTGLEPYHEYPNQETNFENFSVWIME